jgi:hypothetical protein
VSRNLVLFLMLCLGALTASAEDKPCEERTKPLMTLKSSWAAISNAASVLPAECFNGYFGEGISDTIVRKSVQDWHGFVDELKKHSALNDNFLLLYLRSLNSTLNPDDIKAVSKLARESCPRGLTKQCGAILDRARVALEDYDNTKSGGNP